MSKKVRFIAGCPVKGCINGNIPIYWCHNQDDGAMYIFYNGYLECDDCETNGLIIDWKFDCGEHDYEYASFQGYLNMIAVLGHLVADEDFIDDCIDAGKRQRRRFRGK